MQLRFVRLIALLAAANPGQSAGAQARLDPIKLDSGTVVRFHWNDGSEKARLLAPLGVDSLVRYCGYPASSCGSSSQNPARARPLSQLNRLDLRRGAHTGRGALIGAGVGAVGGLLILLGYSLSDRLAPSAGEQVLTVGFTTAVWTGLGALVGASLDNWERIPR